MAYQLEIFQGDQREVVLLKADSYSLGKLPSNDISLMDNSVSRTHFLLERIKKEGYRLVDLNSTNGTFVNGKRIRKKKLRPGDEICAGRTTMVYDEQESSEDIQDIDDQQISKIVPLSEGLSLQGDDRPTDARIHHFNALTKISRELLIGDNLRDNFKQVADVLFQLLEPSSLYIFSCQKPGKNLIPELIRKKTRDDSVTISQSIAFKAIDERVAILSADTLDDARFKKADSVIFYGIKSAISVPVWTKNSIYGLIYADITDIHRTFGEGDLEIVSVVANFLGLSIETIRNRERLAYEKKLRGRLERYHSPGVAAQIMEMQKTNDDLMAHREVEATILFLDIEDFTRRVEKVEPGDIAEFLNYFFTCMTRIIFNHKGTLDKYLGDGLMAVFGVPLMIENHSEQAVDAALEMIRALKDINGKHFFKDEIRIRIGVHTGPVVCGDFGSPQRVDYTVLGNTVNIASRLESSIAAGNEVVVSEDVYRGVADPSQFTSLGPVELKGISRALNLYRACPVKGGRV